jgi:actin, other eukaryote
LCQALFEHHNVPSVSFHNSSVLSLYASGRTDGVVLDSGDGITAAIAVVQGCPLPGARIAKIGGLDVTAQLAALASQGYGQDGKVPEWVSREDALEDVKRTLGAVSARPVMGVSGAGSGSGSAMHDGWFELPDGTSVRVGPERFLAPEMLFSDSWGAKDGLCGLVREAVLAADKDLRPRLLASVVLAGGNTLLAGLPERLDSSLKAQEGASAVRVVAKAERGSAGWMGGAVLASCDSFQYAWVTRAQYQEMGSSALHRCGFL